MSYTFSLQSSTDNETKKHQWPFSREPYPWKAEDRMENWNLRFLSCKILLVILLFRVFGHISYRSDWELVKVDFRPSFPRECTDDDYESWELTNLQVFTVYARTFSYLKESFTIVS